MLHLVSGGATVGPYELVGLLGQGAMGAVYRARHRQLGVERALKLLTPGGPAEREDRFEREGRSLARVEHESVVRVHEAGRHGGRPYLVMDLVAGEPLDGLLARGRPPLPEALALAAGLARGLAALHAAGIVHRDLKPANVLVRVDGRPVIVDFGLALAPERDDRLTRTGALVGTPMYMAPEQLSGGAVSGAVDVHALGSIVFELVTGAHPLGDTCSLHELLSRLSRDDRPAPSQLDPDLPAALDPLCARLLARSPGDRPAAAEAAEALERLAADVRAGTARSTRAVRRRRRVVVAIVALLAAVGLARLALALPDPTAPADLRAPSPAPAASVERAPPVDALALASRALDQVAREADPRVRLDAAQAWLDRWPEHPDRERAAAIARRARALRPLVRLGDDPQTTAARFLDDRRVVAVTPHALRSLDAADGRELARSRQGALAVVVLRGGDLLAAGGPVLARFGGDDLEPRGLWSLEATNATALAATPDGAHVVVGEGGAAWLLGSDEYQRQRELPHDSQVWSVAITPDGRHVVTGSGDSLRPVGVHDTRLRVWTGAGKLVRELDLGARVTALALDPAGDGTCFVGTSRGELLRLSLGSDAPPVELLGEPAAAPSNALLRASAHGTGVLVALAVARDGRVFSGSLGETHELRAWDGREGRERYRVLDLPRGLRSIDLSPDGRRLVTCDERGVVEVWATD